MTEEVKDDRGFKKMVVPYMKVVRMVADPDGIRSYAVVMKMNDKNGKYAGWKHVSKGYGHSTSAFSALGRLIQKHREKTYTFLPENER